MSIVGRTYLERGKPVEVITQWRGKGPRNVAIRREDGTMTVRPFRGLRKLPVSCGDGHQDHIQSQEAGLPATRLSATPRGECETPE